MKYTYHPAADLFPLLDGAEYIRLCKDIRENGLKLPIVIHHDGSILDGRNRLRACEEIGIKPQMIRWAGKEGTEIDYVLSLNLSRRHLDTSQRAMVAASVANMRRGGGKDKGSRDPLISEAAERLDVSPSTVKRAKVVQSEGSKEQIEAVKTGKKTVSEILKEIRPKPEQPKKVETDWKAECERALRRVESLDKELRFTSEALESDERTAPLLAEIKRLQGLVRILEERNAGLLAEKNAAVAYANKLRKATK